MEEKFNPGDLLFLTVSYDRYLRNKHPDLKVSMVNRLAKLESIIDWDSPKGQLIYGLRVKSGKWNKLPIKDNKYILSVYYHDVQGKKGQVGTIERGVPMFGCNPKTKAPFFHKVPDWIYGEIMKQCEDFDVELKEDKEENDG